MFRSHNKLLLSLTAFFTALGLPMGSASAQEQAVGGLEEIVVTARRMEESPGPE